MKNELFNLINLILIRIKESQVNRIYEECLGKLGRSWCIAAAVYSDENESRLACRAAASIIYALSEKESSSRIRNANLILLLNFYGFKQISELNIIKNVNYIVTNSMECAKILSELCEKYIINIKKVDNIVCDLDDLSEQALYRLKRLK